MIDPRICYLCGEGTTPLDDDNEVIIIPDLNRIGLFETVHRGKIFVHSTCLQIIPLFIAAQYKDKFKKFRINLIKEQKKQKIVKKSRTNEWYEVDPS